MRQATSERVNIQGIADFPSVTTLVGCFDYRVLSPSSASPEAASYAHYDGVEHSALCEHG